MTTTHKDECPVSAGQVVKTPIKSATNFIAKCLHPQGFLIGLLTELMYITGLSAYLFIALSLLEVACKAH